MSDPLHADVAVDHMEGTRIFCFLSLFLSLCFDSPIVGDLVVWVKDSLGSETEYEVTREEGKKGWFVAQVSSQFHEERERERERERE